MAQVETPIQTAQRAPSAEKSPAAMAMSALRHTQNVTNMAANSVASIPMWIWIFEIEMLASSRPLRKGPGHRFIPTAVHCRNGFLPPCDDGRL